MTEQEIVSYLKENRTNGVAFGFMPVEVGDWIKANRKKLMGKLICFSDTFGWGAVNTDKPILSLDYIFALPEDFKPEEKPQESGWIEFEIDQKSRDFLVKAETENPNDCDEYYCWFEVERFLRDSVENDRRYTAFGGWQYDDGSKVCKTWHMQPMIFSEVENKLVNLCLCEEQEKTKPAIPIKIRFWRTV